jgi:protein-S-isoprenylcysteine O-methyltransferase Ste14
MAMSALARRALASVLRFVIFLAALLLLAAWTFVYWQLWLFLAVLSAGLFAITLYLIRHDRVLLERRMLAGPKAEKEKPQKIILGLAAALFFFFNLFPGIDHRFGWSNVPTTVVLLGDAAVAVAMLICFFVFRENSFASATVEIHPEQEVISTGLYGIVRHPMYMGALLFVVGLPLALGSWWGLLFVPAIAGLLAWRLVDEERLLVKSLAGYSAYRSRVRYRLVPLVW